MSKNLPITGIITFSFLLLLSACNGETDNGDISIPVKAGGVCGTIAGLICDDDLFCKTPTGECSIPDGAGVCTAIPKECPKVYDPVCGCDGITYGNECEASAASMSIDHTGECNTVAPIDPVLESKDWYAWENHQPSDPIAFHVKGTVVVRSTNYTAKLEKAAPQGINPDILLLNLIVTESSSVGGQAITNLEVQYTEQPYQTGTYTSVTILRDGEGGASIPQIDIVH